MSMEAELPHCLDDEVQDMLEKEEAILPTSTCTLEILCDKDGISSASGVSILQGQWPSQEGQMRGKAAPDGFLGS